MASRALGRASAGAGGVRAPSGRGIWALATPESAGPGLRAARLGPVGDVRDRNGWLRTLELPSQPG